MMTIIQYVIVRADLMKVLKWNIGAVITQACHAVAAINEISRNDELTKEYLSPENLDRMHKCVLAVSVELKHCVLNSFNAENLFRFLIKNQSRASAKL